MALHGRSKHSLVLVDPSAPGYHHPTRDKSSLSACRLSWTETQSSVSS
jgi:hypothetical protein